MRVLAAIPFLLVLAAGQRAPRVTDLLDLYLKGDHAAAVAPLASVRDVKAMAVDFEVDGAGWIKKGATEADMARRRLAAASLALEFAVLRMEDEWYTLRPLIEWGCAELRAAPPSDAELAWQRAAMAAIQGARDNAFNRRLPTPAPTEVIPQLPYHVAHAALRFPDDPVLQFALGFFAELQVPVEGRMRLIDIDTAATASARALDAYRRAASDPALAHEAALAAGYIHLRMKRLDAVMPELAKAAESVDPFVRHMAHLLRGRTLEQLGSREEAIAAYRAALAAIPNAQAASMALAALLHLGDQPDQAREVMSASFASRPAEDPWREYGFGQFRHWTRYRDRMREAGR